MKLMASCETCPNGNLLLWNIVEGKKVAHFQPHADGPSSVAFSPDSSMMVTAGLDAQRRVQIVVWNLQALMSDGPAAAVIARQICEFPIARIRFSPYEELSLVSCGRENVRFFRMKAGFLMGRPVLLNEYSRGFVFSDVAFYAESGALPTAARVSCAFFASNKGLLLKVDCEKNQVLCAYSLHSGSICSLAIHAGYAVTGGEDSRLRIWPLDFSDFLLEAQHEAAVTSVCLTPSGKKLSVGTAAGTLGILDVSEHRYEDTYT
jgi:WD40 repeat protein